MSWLADLFLGEGAKKIAAGAAKEGLSAAKTYKPSAGDLSRQVGANVYEQNLAPLRSAGDIVHGLTGKTDFRDTAHNIADTTNFRSGGQLPTPEAPQLTRKQSLRRGLKGMSGLIEKSEDVQRRTQNSLRTNIEEEEEKRLANLRNFYPDLF